MGATDERPGTGFRYERTLVAIGRLDGMLQHYPLVAGWWCRAQLETAIRLVETEGKRVDAERVLGQLIGIAPAIRDGGTTARVLRVLRTLQERYPRRDTDTLADDQSATIDAVLTTFRRGATGAGALRTVIDGMWTWLDQGGQPIAAQLALSKYLFESQLIAAPWPCLTGVPIRLTSRQDRASWTDAVLDGLAYEAGRGVAKALDLRLAWRSWRHTLGRRRRGSNFERLLDLATALPAITPTLAAEQLGCTVVGAGKLLDELKRAKILAEVSGRGSWKCYVTRDLDSVQVFNRREGLDARAVLWPEPSVEVAARRVHEAGVRMSHPASATPPLSAEAVDAVEAAVDLGGLLAQLERKTAIVAGLVEPREKQPAVKFRVAEEDD